ncbi:MAG: glycosyltransferase, partial [Anaerolineae bacterium]|nr:glycosyltransferase [Anaerolineae bacterium]
MKVVILSSVHHPLDTRIFYKEAQTLAHAGYQVVLIAPHTSKEEVISGVRIIGLPRARSRWRRPLLWGRVLWRALRERGDVYHFHDPELLPIGVLLQWLSHKPVIYDAHEWYPGKILLRSWLPKLLRPLVRTLFATVEPLLARQLAATITADHLTAEWLQKHKVPEPVILYNYPLRDIYPSPPSRNYGAHGPNLLFIGTVGTDRGIFEMLDTVAKLLALGIIAHLYVIGPIKTPHLRKSIREHIQRTGVDEFVHFEGFIPQDKLFPYLKMAHLGLVISKPEIYALNIPTKMFEYMAAGLPVIATRAEMTSYFLEPTGAGVLVDSLDPQDY